MRDYSRTHFGDSDLLRHADRMVGRGRFDDVEFLADLAEIDLRQLYREGGHASLFAYCVDHHHLSEDETCRRIQAARGRRFPAVFHELESGRLHLTAVGLMTPHLTEENAEELIAACVHKSSRAIDQYLKQRFPVVQARPSRPTLRAIPNRVVGQAAQRVDEELFLPANADTPTEEPSLSVARRIDDPQTAVEQVLSPLPPALFYLGTEIDQDTHDDIRAIQDLLGRTVPFGDLSQVVKWMAKFCRAHLQKKRFGSKAPRRARPSQSRRHVPVQVRRAVLDRDGGQCTFVSAAGHRCASRKSLEFDHARPVALGGKATVDNMRLRCRAHNQLEAERAFGKAFVQAKREARRASSPSATNPQKPP